jgi:hypothetical protein
LSIFSIQTKNERSKSERIKEKRKAALAARLAVVKHRKRVKLGLPECDHGKNFSIMKENLLYFVFKQ